MEPTDMEPLASLISKAFEDERLYGKAKQNKESEWDHVIQCEHGIRENKCAKCGWKVTQKRVGGTKKQRRNITIYVVEGETGEYEDCRTWIVAAYKSKAKAEKKLEEATNEVERLLNIYPSPSDVRQAIREGKDINKADLNMQLDYTGTEYNIRTITTDD